MWGWSPTLEKSEDLESFGTLKCSELDSKAQNTSHWGVLGVIGKVLKRRYQKWPRIGHLDICRPSYGKKKRQESRPLKVGNRPLPDLRMESATRRGLQVWFRPRHDQTSQLGVMSSQSPRTPPRTVSGQFQDSNLGVPGKRAIWM